MRKVLTYRTLALAAIIACTSAALATDRPRLSSSAPRIPSEARDLYGDLLALKFDSGSGQGGAQSPLSRLAWHETPHFVLGTDAGRIWSMKAGNTLEQTRKAFYTAFDDAGFSPTPLDKRLVWVAFTRRDDFHNYALSIDRLDMSWSDGYYSTRTNRVALVCEGAHPGHAGGTTADSTELHAQPAEGFTHLAQATHEAVHQLAFNSGLQKRGVMYPLWASEGLATNFEADGNDPFGPGHNNEHRRRQLIRAIQRDGIRPLTDFVVMTRVPVADADATHDVYAQSWAMFRFLFTHRPNELRRYLSELASLDAGRRDQASLRREFVRCFGRIETLEKSWRAYLRLVANPVDSTAGR